MAKQIEHGDRNGKERYVFMEMHRLSFRNRDLALCLASLVSQQMGHFLSIVFRKNPSLECSSDMNQRVTWKAVFSILLLKVLILLAKPFEKLGTFIEDCLNFIFAKDGFRQTLLMTSLFKPGDLPRLRSEDPRYYSFIGLLDSRQHLCRERDSLKGETALQSDLGYKLAADLCMMASKLAYENKSVVKRVVNEKWKMQFVDFFDCWNEYLKSRTTQAFIFTGDANEVVVAFRGTQLFNTYDWCTDFDFSYCDLHGMGRVHVGFLEAFGLKIRLRDETLQKAKGATIPSTPTSDLPQEVVDDPNKVLAYDAICNKLRDILKKNSGAKLYITGHSLGGALAALFPALLMWKKDDPILARLEGVFTFGQPRVGDNVFAEYMKKNLSMKKKYFRVVYCNDIVPRVPFDNHLFQFKHIGPCYYYSSPYEAEALHEEPHKNVYSLAFRLAHHLHAIRDLFRSLGLRYLKRGTDEEYEETVLGLMMRIAGLLTPGISAHNPANYVDAIRLAAPPTFHLRDETSTSEQAD